MISTPFNHLVPKDVEGNLRWRQAILRRVNENPAFAEVVWQACALDPLFYINTFVWTYDPRRKPFARLPMILHPFQEEGVLEVLEAIGNHDLLIEKSRDMGASWICIAAFEWCWHFRPMQSFLMVSRTENYVDDSENPKSLFWKVDFIHQNLPPWLMPRGYGSEHRRKMHMTNPENGSVIDGESTTGNVARGDRRTAILLDEFAAVEQGQGVLSSTRDATNCRIFNSTPAGTGNAYHDMRQTDVKKLRFHWSIHPLKSRGLYTTDEDGNLKVLDPAGYPADYMSILDGKLRSPWYDRECARAVSPQEIAQELDIDYLGSGWQFFKADAIQEAIRQYARSPIIVGDLEYDTTTAEPLRFRDDPKGRMSLWLLLGKDNNPPLDRRYVVGADISAGTGASNSCIQAWDESTQEKVLEYANPFIRPEELAFVAVAIARWLGNAFLIWEQNGPGRQFGSRVIELGYRNIYYRKNDESISGKVTDIPGWASTKETKQVLLGDYRSAIESGVCVNRSREAMQECLEYIFAPNGSIAHSREDNKTDPSGAKSNHGDRVIADALAWKGINERARNPRRGKPEIPPGSLAWRRQQREAAMKPTNRELEEGWR